MRFSAAFKSILFGSVLAMGATGVEAQLALTVTDATRTETNTGVAALNFVVTRTAGGVPVTFTATTIAGTALGGGVDYADLSAASFTMTAAQTTKTVAVQITGELLDESNEQFQVNFLPVTSGVTINGAASATVNGFITDNDAATLSIANLTVNEDAGTAVFTVTQSVPSINPISVNFATLAQTALAGGVDFTHNTGTLSFPANSTPAPPYPAPAPKFISVLLNATDDLDENNETFKVTLFGATGATILAANGVATLTDSPSDLPPTLSVGNLLINEGTPTGNTVFSFTLSLDNPSGKNVSVTATTADNTATLADNDYVFKTQNYVLGPGELTRQFSVVVKADPNPEPDETFDVLLSSVVNANAVNGVGTILNDDTIPQLSISDVTLQEGKVGIVPYTPPTSFTFTVTRTPPLTDPVNFTWSTSDVTALAGTDYTANLTGTGTIPNGAATTTITVDVIGDLDPEATETFNVTLGASPVWDRTPVNGGPLVAIVADGTGVGTILNDDAVASNALKISEFRLSGPGGDQDEFVEIANTTTDPVTVFTTDSSAGFAVVNNGGGTVFVIPNGTTIPARGHYLATNPAGYTLTNFGGTNGGKTDDALTPTDDWQVSDILDNTGLALFASSTTFDPTTRLDSVGFVGDAGTLFVEPALGGPGLPSGGASGLIQYSFVRKYVYGGGSLQDLEDSAGDFVLVAVNTGFGPIGGTLPVLGGPSPENLNSETERGAQLTMSSPDGGYTYFPPTFGPNAPKALEFYRVFTNGSGQTLNSIRFKVANITGVNNTVVGQADLRPTVSGPKTPTTTTYLGLTLVGAPTMAYSQTTPSSSFPAPAGTAPNGGLNTMLKYSGPSVLNTQPFAVNFRVEYVNSGSFFFWLVPEGK